MMSGGETVVKLRGLPWAATDEDIGRFFSPLHIVSVHLTLNHHGRATGEGYVEFGSEADAISALEYHKRTIGSRYVEVFKCPRTEMDRVVNPPPVSNSGGAGGIVRLRGLPYNATMSDISAFFSGFDIIPNGIHLVVGRDGRANGEAYVEFSSDGQAEAAIKAKHREKIGTRYIELFRGTKAEMSHATNPYGGVYDNRQNYDLTHNISELVSVRMLGLPYSAQESDVINFFSGLNIVPGGVHFVYNANQRPTGEGFVEFVTIEDARRALERHKYTMGSRYIELFRCTKAEMLMDLGMGGGLGGGMHGGGGGMHGGGMGLGALGGGLGGLGGLGMGGLPMGGLGMGMGGFTPQQMQEVYSALIQTQLMMAGNPNMNMGGYGGWPGAGGQGQGGHHHGHGGGRNDYGGGLGGGGGGGGMGSQQVRMRGLPYQATVSDVAAFFNGYDVLPQAIVLGGTQDGRPSGEAWVQFGSPDEAARAVREKNRAHMGSRYVELFLN